MDDENDATALTDLSSYRDIIGCAGAAAVLVTVMLLGMASVFEWPLWLRAVIGVGSVMAPAVIAARWAWRQPGLRLPVRPVMSQPRVRRVTIQLLAGYTLFVAVLVILALAG